MKVSIMKRFLKIGCFGILTIGFIFTVFPKTRSVANDLLYNLLPGSRGPASFADLCKVLGRNPDEYPLCPTQDLYGTFEEVFPLGIATREQVREVMGIYYIETTFSGNGYIRDFYGIKRKLINPEQVIFTFDKNGYLQFINFQS
jgi:hypothetical protein